MIIRRPVSMLLAGLVAALTVAPAAVIAATNPASSMLTGPRMIIRSLASPCICP